MFQGLPVTQFGSNPWKVTVKMVGGDNTKADLMGTKTVVVINGWANFTDLSITLPGSGKNQQ